MNCDRFATTSRPHRGISLLEVMISIGVVGIGLIGVAALIPLAHHKAAQGVQEDRKALMGKRAFREFRVRDLDRPGNGVIGVDLPSPYWVWFNSPTGNPYLIYANGRLVRQTYCLDPLGVATKGVNQFPANFPPLKVPRLTLLGTRPEDLRRTMTPAQVNQMLINETPFMTAAQAEEIFRMQDELVLEHPDNKNLPPYQVFLEYNKRLSSGSYSWMATIVPDPNPQSDLWTLSIVVFHRRDLTSPAAQEIVTQVIDPPPGVPPPGVPFSLMNSDVKVITVEELTTTYNNADAGVRHINNGDWVMLMRQRGISPDMKWHRVISASELVTEQDTRRELSLTGADWAPSLQPLFAVYIRNVVAVYEKTIRMRDDDSSLYAW